MNIEPGTVLEATHRPEDLIPAFTTTLEMLDNETATRVVDSYGDIYEWLDEGIDLEDFDPEIVCELVDELFDALNAVAPEGMYFGAHPGDGSDFGFWPVENEL